jgi:hypothetical protein
MTEAHQSLAETLAVRPTYEQLRDATPHREVREAWQEADRRIAYARGRLANIDADESLSDEGKYQRAQDLVDKEVPEILARYERARQKAQETAESDWKFSIPMPSGMAGEVRTLATVRASDSSELIAVQNEAEAIAQRIEGKSLTELTRERSHAGGNRGIREPRSRRTEALRREYDAAMREGGLEGKVRALGVVRVCEQMGVDLDAIVDGHRKAGHRKAYQHAMELEQIRQAIPSGQGRVTNPYDTASTRRRAGAVGTYRSQGKSGAAMVGGNRDSLFPQRKRKRSWK